MKVNEVAARLQVAPGTIYDLCASGQLPHNRVGVGRGTIRISEEQLKAYLDANQRQSKYAITPPSIQPDHPSQQQPKARPFKCRHLKM